MENTKVLVRATEIKNVCEVFRRTWESMLLPPFTCAYKKKIFWLSFAYVFGKSSKLFTLIGANEL